jgi:hypothetical protein
LGALCGPVEIPFDEEILGWDEDAVTKHCRKAMIEILPHEKEALPAA